jgi:hypothetical protein
MAAATLLCKQCNFENEPERVYCHNCGAKLDRALLPPEATKREDPQAVQARVRSVVRPSRLMLLPILSNLLLSLLVAAIAAAVFLMFQPPDGRPNFSPDVVMMAPPISDNLEDLLQSPSPRRLDYTEDQVNAFLQGSLRAKEGSAYGLSVRYERSFVHFGEGYCRATLQEGILGYSFYVSSTDGVEIKNGQVVTHPIGGSIGRLPLPAKIMPQVEKAFAPIWAALDAYKKLVARLGSITFHPGSVEVVGKPPGVS